MMKRLKDFIYTWQHVNAVNSLNRDLKSKNEQLERKVEHYENNLERSLREISKLVDRIKLFKTDLSATEANKKADYLMIDKLLEQLEEVNKSGLADKTKEQNQIINRIRAITKKELDNATNID